MSRSAPATRRSAASQYRKPTVWYLLLALVLAAVCNGQAMTIVPSADSIWKTSSGWRACFGYDNPNAMTVGIPSGPKNNFFPASYAGDPYPTSFSSGRWWCVFTVNITQGVKMTWSLISPNNESRREAVYLP